MRPSVGVEDGVSDSISRGLQLGLGEAAKEGRAVYRRLLSGDSRLA
jgi:hypothetical protein